jgi:hypothetical protein
MALVPSAEYPAQTSTSDPNFPYGKARNISVASDGTGFPLEKEWVNDLLGFEQALLVATSITPSGNPDEVGTSDYLDALRKIAAGAHIAEVRRISATDQFDGPVAYFAGLYIIGNRNASAQVLTSPDLNQWTASAVLGISPFVFFDFAQSDTTLLAVEGTGTAVNASTDGTTWAAQGALPGTFTGDPTIAYHSANLRFVACDGASGRTAYSDDDGATWVDNGVADADGIFNPVSNGTRLVAAITQGAGPGELYGSANGIAWANVHTFGAGMGVWNIVYCENEWIAQATDGTNSVLAVSDDGITWTDLAGSIPIDFQGIAEAGGVLYALSPVPDPDVYYVSLDHGRTWFTLLESAADLDSALFKPVRTANRRLLTPGSADGTGTDIVVGNRIPGAAVLTFA